MLVVGTQLGITVPVSLVGARLGLMLYGRVDDAVFRRLVLVLLAP